MRYPVVIFAYKRVSSLKTILTKVATAGARKIYIFVDGPHTASDKRAVNTVTQLVQEFQTNHHELELITTFHAQNVGLKRNIIAGLDKVFEHEIAALILEDDCLPHPDFFRYADILLTRYQHTERIMGINGTTVAPLKEGESYTFTRYPQVWGWATWARAWHVYDREARLLGDRRWPSLKRQLWPHSLLRWYWQHLAFLAQVGQIRTWDIQWSLTVFGCDGLMVSPAVNLIQNVGFDGQGMNTELKSPLASLPTRALSWPLHHPRHLRTNPMVDRLSERAFYLNWLAIGGMLRQYGYYLWRHYAPGH